MADKTPDEILEEQRAEATRVYSETINGLKATSIELESKIKNLKSTLDEAFSSKIKELSELESEARNRLAELDNLRAELAASKRGIETDLLEAKQILNNVNLEKQAHETKIKIDLGEIENSKTELAKRLAEIIEKEESINIKEKTADLTLSAALEKEKEVNLKIEDFNEALENYSKIAEEQKLIEAKNKEDAEANNNRSLELNALKANLDEQVKSLANERSELEASRASLANRKLEIDEANDNLKQKNIRYAVDMQRLQDKQKDIDHQIGKLNELKNNVEALMKAKEGV